MSIRTRDVVAVPFEISAVSNGYQLRGMGTSDHMDQYCNDGEGNTDNKYKGPCVSFPDTRSVLWNRNPTGKEVLIDFIGSTRNVKLSINERSLCLAYKQLQVDSGDVFNGFFIGALQQSDESITIEVDRFDPGTLNRCKLNHDEDTSSNAKIPTTRIPGDICIPVTASKGVAFIDHRSTETYTSQEFLKTFHLLSSWFSRKDKLDVTHFLNLKVKCLFHEDQKELLAFFSACCVHPTEIITLRPINSIPIIPTALAKSLEDNLSLSKMDNAVKMGYLTMEQTRKLLLLLESDPKASSLPIVGVWICGVDTVYSMEVWCCCVRFLRNVHITERVYVPPCNYLLVLFSPVNIDPLFYEFSSQGKDNIEFRFVSWCEGIPLQKTGEDDIIFETPQSNGLLHNNFNLAQSSFGSGIPINNDVQDEGTNSNQVLDDSLPKVLTFHSPHPQQRVLLSAPENQAALDVSLCESMVSNAAVQENAISYLKHNDGQHPTKELSLKSPLEKSIEINTEKTEQVTHRKGIKYPRQTKASLIRMNLNKPTEKKKCQANVLQSKHSVKSTAKNHLNVGEITSSVKDVILQQVNDFIQTQDLLIEQCNTPRDESLPRIPVAIRSGEKDIRNNLSLLEPTYCPENYSDFEDKSFLIENSRRSSSPLEEIPFVKSPSNDIEEPSPSVDEGQGVQLDQKMSEENSQNSDLYNLMVGQQKQLLQLNEQLQVFLTRKDQQTEQLLQKPDSKPQVHEVDEDCLNKDGVVTTNDLQSFHADQRKQLQELQQQVQLFMQHTSKQNTVAEISTQYSILEAEPSRTSIGVNTGKSLLWPIENMTCTGADTTPRGNKQAEGLTENMRKFNVSRTNKPCRCCHHCLRSEETDETLKVDISKTSSLSEVQSDHIGESMINPADESNHTVASSLKAVDMPVFDDTQENGTASAHQITDLYDWERSPKLGESASVLVEKRRQQKQEEHQQQQQQQHQQQQNHQQQRHQKQQQQHQNHQQQQQQQHHQQEYHHHQQQHYQQQPQQRQQQELETEHGIVESEKIDPVLNKEFYAQMMNQVQKLMEAQNISSPERETRDREIRVEEEEFPEPPIISPEQRLMKVRDATLRELQRLTTENIQSSVQDKQRRSRSMSAVSPPHPKINYIPMSVDDTFYDYSGTTIDNIAAKYLPTELLVKHKSETKNKTVKFEGVYQWETPGPNGVPRNMTSVNFSCNMSIASRKYLHKYELLQNEELDDKTPLKEHNGRKAVAQKYSPVTKDETVSSEGSVKENILDLKKLRNLPKLKY